MSKKKHKKHQVLQDLKLQKQISPSEEFGISKKGWKVIITSIFSLIIGFILLKFTNQEGNNWASIISPIVIILSYIFIAVGIVAKD